MTLTEDSAQKASPQTLLLTMKRLQEQEEEIEALRQQHLLLKSRCEKERAQSEQYKKQLEQVASTSTPSSTAHEELEASLTESKLHSKQLERVIHFLRDRAEGAHLEATQLRQEFQGHQETIETLTTQRLAFQQQVEALTQQIIQERAKQEETFGKKQRELDSLREQLDIIRRENQQLEMQLNVKRNDHDERESNLKQAQQHLAKKMRDLGVLTEQNEEQRIQLLEAQRSLNEMQNRAIAMQQSLEMQLQHERRIHETLQERAQNSETQVKKWEEKYFQMYDRWQEAESRYQGLRAIEDRHQQIKALLANLNDLVAPSTIHPSLTFPDASPRPKQTYFD